MLLKEVREVGYFLKPQGVSYFGNVPGGLLQQDFGFLVNAARDDLGRCFTGCLFQDFVQVIYMHFQIVRKVFGGF